MRIRVAPSHGEVDELIRILGDLALVAPPEQLEVVCDHPEGFLEVVGSDVGKLLELLVRSAQFVGLLLEGFFGPFPLAEFFFEINLRLEQVDVPPLDLGQHFVEPVDEGPQFVIAQFLAPDREVLRS